MLGCQHFQRRFAFGGKCMLTSKVVLARDCKEICKLGEHPGKVEGITGAGDVVSIFAQPVAKAIDAVAGTNLQNCGGCKKRRQALNQIRL